MNAGNAEYSISTALNQLDRVRIYFHLMYKVNSLCFQPTDILYQPHHGRLVEIATCVSPNSQLSAAIHLCGRKRNQIKQSRDGSSVLEYLQVQLLGSIGEIIKEVNDLI